MLALGGAVLIGTLGTGVLPASAAQVSGSNGYVTYTKSQSGGRYYISGSIFPSAGKCARVLVVFRAPLIGLPRAESKTACSPTGFSWNGAEPIVSVSVS